MGIFTALSIHESMMDEHGVEEGTEATRDILYSNSWDLNTMEQVMESFFDAREVPNVPRHMRETHEILEGETENSAEEEAERLFRQLRETGDEDELLEKTVRGKALVDTYEDVHGFSNPPDVLRDLDEEVINQRFELERLPDPDA
jgi:hypothetical protein